MKRSHHSPRRQPKRAKTARPVLVLPVVRVLRWDVPPLDREKVLASGAGC